MSALDVSLAVVAVALAVGLAWSILTRRPPHRLPVSRDARRILVPFSGSLDQTVLDAAIRITRAEHAVLVPAYLLVVPLQWDESAPLRTEVARALPVLEAVEHAALRAGIPVDARIEKGRTLTHALRRLWAVERFDRIVAPAPVDGRGGFTEKQLAWLLMHAPSETLVFKPAPPQLVRPPAAIRQLPAGSVAQPSPRLSV